jgi:hypothetical protein
MERHRTLITYLLAFLLTIGTVIRYLISFRGDPSLSTLTILLAAFLLPRCAAALAQPGDFGRGESGNTEGSRTSS